MTLTINIKKGDKIDKILKTFKNKIKKFKLIKLLKNKLYYIKPSIKRKIKNNKKKFLIKNNFKKYDN
ncbi:MAG: hypothetical protein RDO_0670 [Flavobacteriales endosymbiont of Rhyzopertha dominica]|nr:MAG: 30S ribosomal protein S21 [Candidatus Shikimatogenerans bostrichidophilus]